MGVAGSILISVVPTVFQLWLARREEERKARDGHYRQLRHIHLPPDEDVIRINANRDGGDISEDSRKAAGVGSLPLSIFVGSLLVYQANDAMLEFLATNRPKRALST
jgi:hypothetical protein